MIIKQSIGIKIDGKTYYLGDRGEMVVGWQYVEIHGTGYRIIYLIIVQLVKLVFRRSGTILDKMVLARINR